VFKRQHIYSPEHSMAQKINNSDLVDVEAEQVQALLKVPSDLM